MKSVKFLGREPADFYEKFMFLPFRIGGLAIFAAVLWGCTTHDRYVYQRERWRPDREYTPIAGTAGTPQANEAEVQRQLDEAALRSTPGATAPAAADPTAPGGGADPAPLPEGGL